MKEVIYVGDKKISVFKIPQEDYIESYTKNKNCLSTCCKPGIKLQERRPYQKIEEYRTEEKIKMGRMRPTIEEKRSENKPDLRGLGEAIFY
jgi:hypothetical protein